MALWKFLISWLKKTHERSSAREGSTQGSNDEGKGRDDHPQIQEEFLHAHEPAQQAAIVDNQGNEADDGEADAGTDKVHNIAGEEAPHESEGIARASGLRRLFARKGPAAVDVEAPGSKEMLRGVSTGNHGDRGLAHMTVPVQK